jgi:carbamoyl-phosphate synthase large subunit
MRILVTGAGSVMGQSIYRALELHDFPEAVEVHFGNSDPLGAGMYFKSARLPIVQRPTLPLAASPNYITHVRDYIDKWKIDLIYSGTQHELEKLAAVGDEIGKVATLPLGSTQLCLDKMRTNIVLSGHGVRTPWTFRMADLASDRALTFPAIVKPNTSSASRGIRVMRSGSEFDSWRDELGASAANYLIQQFIDGDELTCGCYIDRYTRKLSTIILRRTLTADGATGFGEVIESEAVDEYLHAVAASLQKEGLDWGHFNVQLRIDADGPCLFEINGRLSSTESPKAKFGFNSTAAYAVNLHYEAPYSFGQVRAGQRFLRYYEEVFF